MFICSICSRPQPTYFFLKRHISVHHVHKKGTKLICGQFECTRAFNSLPSLYKHIRQKHFVKNNSVEKNTSAEDIPKQGASKIVKISDNETSDSEQSSEGCAYVHNDFHEFLFMCKQYAKPHLSRKDVNDIIKDTKTMVESYNSGQYNDWKPFENISTETRRINLFKQRGCFVTPQTISLGRVDGFAAKSSEMQFISLKRTLECRFADDSFRHRVDHYISEQSLHLTDFKDGLSYGAMSSNSALPYVLYFDDFETGNPLGSHKGVHKVGAIYCSLRCLPTYMYSNLSNIYLLCLFNSKTRERFGNKRILAPIIEELRELECKGININGKVYKFVLAGVLGDNLGINSILGMVESFSANYYCRFCKAHKDDCRSMTKENPFLVRDKVNYDEDVSKGDPSQTGLKEPCVFNQLNSFHFTSNFIVDVMHDICEGVANVDMCLILNYYIDNNIFSLLHLNARIKAFSFSDTNKSNRPPVITEKRLKSGDLGFNASEMHCFVMNFPLIVGDLVPFNCKVWELFLRLLYITSICSSKHVHKRACAALSVYVEEHHEMFISLFKQHLRPKFHFLIHYARILSESGPLSHNWTFRFEGKHLIFKMYSSVCRSRINVIKSLAMRHQLLQSSKIHLLDESINIHTDIPNNGNCCKWASRCGITLRIGAIICIKEIDLFPVFGKITVITVTRDLTNLELMLYETIAYVSHYNSYEIAETLSKTKLTLSDFRKPLANFRRNNALYVNFNQFDKF